MAEKKSAFLWGTGRRKNAIARVRICEGTGQFLINNREVKDYLPRFYWSSMAVQPLAVAGVEGKIDVFVNAHGGGLTGQAGAIRLGVSRCIPTRAPRSKKPASSRATRAWSNARRSDSKAPAPTSSSPSVNPPERYENTTAAASHEAAAVLYAESLQSAVHPNYSSGLYPFARPMK